MRERLEETTLELRTRELERERALKLATEAHSASLESRIHPHFLFNTLNSISSLIPEDPARAERLVEQMAALLRFSLDANQSGLVPLESELKIVGDYLEIERTRFGDRLRYRLTSPPELHESQVPAAGAPDVGREQRQIRHHSGSRGRRDPYRGGALEPGVPAGGLGFRSGFPSGVAPASHGMDNLTGRLSTLFGSQAALTLERAGGRNKLTCPCRRPRGTCGHFWLTTKRSL